MFVLEVNVKILSYMKMLVFFFLFLNDYICLFLVLYNKKFLFYFLYGYSAQATSLQLVCMNLESLVIVSQPYE